jgi:hypothetical protein
MKGDTARKNMMKRKFWGLLYSLVVMSVFLPQNIFAGSTLQISAAPGVSIWLDKNLIGKTTKEQNGLVITDLAPGEYALRASLPGYDISETLLTVKNNQSIEWRIKLAKPTMQVEETVKLVNSLMIEAKPTGTVVLRSIPLNAEIFFDGESIGSTDKKLTYVPAAEHAVKFIFQQGELVEKFSLQPDEFILLRADFTEGKIAKETIRIESKMGPVVIKMQTARKRKPAMFPHRKHQEMYGCANCHHGRDSKGKQVPYTEGMEIQHCVTCHNQKMENKKLNSLMLASHTKCKGCHKKVVAESGTAGPIAKCMGCHEVKEDE